MLKGSRKTITGLLVYPIDGTVHMMPATSTNSYFRAVERSKNSQSLWNKQKKTVTTPSAKQTILTGRLFYVTSNLVVLSGRKLNQRGLMIEIAAVPTVALTTNFIRKIGMYKIKRRLGIMRHLNGRTLLVRLSSHLLRRLLTVRLVKSANHSSSLFDIYPLKALPVPM